MIKTHQPKQAINHKANQIKYDSFDEYDQVHSFILFSITYHYLQSIFFSPA